MKISKNRKYNNNNYNLNNIEIVKNNILQINSN